MQNEISLFIVPIPYIGCCRYRFMFDLCGRKGTNGIKEKSSRTYIRITNERIDKNVRNGAFVFRHLIFNFQIKRKNLWCGRVYNTCYKFSAWMAQIDSCRDISTTEKKKMKNTKWFEPIAPSCLDKISYQKHI